MPLTGNSSTCSQIRYWGICKNTHLVIVTPAYWFSVGVISLQVVLRLGTSSKKKTYLVVASIGLENSNPDLRLLIHLNPDPHNKLAVINP